MSQTLWDAFNARRFRLGAALTVAGLIGLALMAFILRVPLGILLVIALVLGMWGIGGAVLEMIVQAVARTRAPINLRPRDPWEFIACEKGYINLAHVHSVTKSADGILLVRVADLSIRIGGDEARQLGEYLDGIATPVWAYATEPFVEDEPAAEVNTQAVEIGDRP